jgi:hypothetical protein
MPKVGTIVIQRRGEAADRLLACLDEALPYGVRLMASVSGDVGVADTADRIPGSLYGYVVGALDHCERTSGVAWQHHLMVLQPES